MINYIVILIILAIVAMAVRYIVKEKKKGNVCIGCSNASGCSGGCHCSSEPKQP